VSWIVKGKTTFYHTGGPIRYIGYWPCKLTLLDWGGGLVRNEVRSTSVNQKVNITLPDFLTDFGKKGRFFTSNYNLSRSNEEDYTSSIGKMSKCLNVYPDQPLERFSVLLEEGVFEKQGRLSFARHLNRARSVLTSPDFYGDTVVFHDVIDEIENNYMTGDYGITASQAFSMLDTVYDTDIDELDTAGESLYRQVLRESCNITSNYANPFGSIDCTRLEAVELTEEAAEERVEVETTTVDGYSHILRMDRIPREKIVRGGGAGYYALYKTGRAVTMESGMVKRGQLAASNLYTSKVLSMTTEGDYFLVSNPNIEPGYDVERIRSLRFAFPGDEDDSSSGYVADKYLYLTDGRETSRFLGVMRPNGNTGDESIIPVGYAGFGQIVMIDSDKLTTEESE
jgi:hypothetical protein